MVQMAFEPSGLVSLKTNVCRAEAAFLFHELQELLHWLCLALHMVLSLVPRLV